MTEARTEFDSMGAVEVSADKLWGAQTQRSLQHFSIGQDLIPREMIAAYAILKRSAATANHASGRLEQTTQGLIVQVCDELLAGQHLEMFPLHVWMTGSGTQFNMNVNEVISNRCCQLTGTAVGSKAPVHPNDHVNMSQSSNDSFPSAMYIAAAVEVSRRLVPAVTALRDAIAKSWDGHVSRRLRKKVEMLFAHLKRILKLDRLRDRRVPATSSSSRQPPRISASWRSWYRYQIPSQPENWLARQLTVLRARRLDPSQSATRLLQQNRP
jgi:hypothetical protein